MAHRTHNTPKPGIWLIKPLNYPTSIDTPTSPGWQIAIRVTNDNGVPSIAELRVMPATHRTQLGSGQTEIVPPEMIEPWFKEAARAPTPPGGLPTRALRHIRLADALRTTTKELLAADKLTAGAILEGRLSGDHGLNRELLETPIPTKRRRRSDLELARIAATYLNAFSSGSKHPRQDTAKQLGPGWTPERVRDHLHDARRRDLLTRPTHGTAGGNLTEKAQDLLNQPPRT